MLRVRRVAYKIKPQSVKAIKALADHHHDDVCSTVTEHASDDIIFSAVLIGSIVQLVTLAGYRATK